MTADTSPRRRTAASRVSRKKASKCCCWAERIDEWMVGNLHDSKARHCSRRQGRARSRQLADAGREGQSRRRLRASIRSRGKVQKALGEREGGARHAAPHRISVVPGAGQHELAQRRSTLKGCGAKVPPSNRSWKSTRIIRSSAAEKKRRRSQRFDDWMSRAVSTRRCCRKAASSRDPPGSSSADQLMLVARQN